MADTPYDLIGHARIAALAASPASDEPVATLYFGMLPNGAERRLALKNLLKEAEEQARRDTGSDDDRRKRAIAAIQRLAGAAEAILHDARRGTFVAFARGSNVDEIRIPLVLRDRISVGRIPYTSPLSAVLDQYERYGIVLADHRRGRFLEVYLGVIVERESLDEKRTDTRRIAVGGGHQGLEETRRRHHVEYELHRHLQSVADRAFAHLKLHGFDKLIVAGPQDTVPRLVEHLHPYLRARIVARETWPLDLPRDELLARALAVEDRVEAEKERALIATVRDHVCGDLLATTGFDETLRALYYGKVGTLIVEEGGAPRRGRQCPECRFLFPRAEDETETTPTLVECPLCKRPTRTATDLVEEAVELAVLSGAKVEHVTYARDDLKALGGLASILRFR